VRCLRVIVLILLSICFLNSCSGLIIDEQEDVTEEEKAEILKLNIDVTENRENEFVFNISIDDFISSYNGFYWNDRKSLYLSPSTEWVWFTYDNAIHSDYETDFYEFTEDENIWSLPAIVVYVPKNSENIQEITLNFDDHSYTESMYNLYEEICYYTLKIFFPDFENEKIIELYSTLINLAYDNMYNEPYSNNPKPCALYYKDSIGLYPYFAVGESVRICIIPITEQYINEIVSQGVEIHNIDDDYLF